MASRTKESEVFGDSSGLEMPHVLAGGEVFGDRPLIEVFGDRPLIEVFGDRPLIEVFGDRPLITDTPIEFLQ
jgi:hypothetical protein